MLGVNIKVMDENEKLLLIVKLNYKLAFYRKLEKKIDEVMNGTLDLNDWSHDIHYKFSDLEPQIDKLKDEVLL